MNLEAFYYTVDTVLRITGALTLLWLTVSFFYPKKRTAAEHPNHPSQRSHLRMLLEHSPAVPFDWAEEVEL